MSQCSSAHTCDFVAFTDHRDSALRVAKDAREKPNSHAGKAIADKAIADKASSHADKASAAHRLTCGESQGRSHADKTCGS